MQEFSSISVSSYEAGSLAERLTEQSRDGWHVVAIIPTGSTITAYLSRDSDGEPTQPGFFDTGSEPTPEPESAPADEPREPVFAPGATAITPEPASEPAPDTPSEPVVETTPDVAADTTPDTTPDAAPETAAATTDTASTAGAAPAGWYADPSGRFELRYWDGGQWTEHVSRAGQQYTDPPVA